MGMLFALTLPALVVGLVLLGVVDLARARRRRRDGAAAAPVTAAAGFDVLGSVFDPGHRHRIEHDEFVEMDRDDDGDAAPPVSRVNLDTGIARIVVPSGRRPARR